MRLAIAVHERPTRNAVTVVARLCESHVETCSGCGSVFCPACLSDTSLGINVA